MNTLELLKLQHGELFELRKFGVWERNLEVMVILQVWIDGGPNWGQWKLNSRNT